MPAAPQAPVMLAATPAIARDKEIVERIRIELESHKIEYDPGQFLNITASFGIAALRHAEGYENCLKNADNALYKAKSLGRNKVCVS